MINVRHVFGLPGIVASSPGLNLIGAIESRNEYDFRGKQAHFIFEIDLCQSV